ncbi:hypothetical protein [Deinococcus peraridilitoris]|uniref:Uncharacterized protein n=1 Tax=Deinococcus peraridilitoris (strain DSM 19664 / LMG 22246 / CIP 109416 / KR-200) TaxID=937777 RepID=K9ZZE5_DEIPD|nr:hypothetical protein [Deinococcus peraridilitoris]AFZ66569.1 hypothetical protein Deipe_1005 [Deinococcus peraridilitoris DSM 19664]
MWQWGLDAALALWGGAYELRVRQRRIAWLARAWLPLALLFVLGGLSARSVW